jgi:hypothetical protein
MGKRNPMAKALASDLYRKRVVGSEKVYDRRQEQAAIAEEQAHVYEDGEVIGWSDNRHTRTGERYLLCWDADKGEAYCCGETLSEFGADNLSIGERQRLELL